MAATRERTEMGAKEKFSTSMHLDHETWSRLKRLALAEGVSANKVVIRALRRELDEKRVKPLTD